MTLPETPAPSASVETAWFDDDDRLSAVVYDEATAMVHRLNDTAAIVWSMVDGATTPAAMSEELAAAFGAPLDIVQRDVTDLLTQFADKGLLDGTDPLIVTVPAGYQPPRRLGESWVLPSIENP